MSSPPAQPRLPPFPDDVVEARDVGRAIGFLLSLGLPSRIAANHLARWAAVAGVELSPEHYAAVGRRIFPRRE